MPPKLSDYVLALSPNKISEINLCPATPKSKIVNEWYVENRQLKAQVESERFERGFLETQLKQKDDEINVLREWDLSHIVHGNVVTNCRLSDYKILGFLIADQERRKFLADIQQLKSKLNEKDTENIPVNCNDSQLEAVSKSQCCIVNCTICANNKSAAVSKGYENRETRKADAEDNRGKFCTDVDEYRKLNYKLRMTFKFTKFTKFADVECGCPPIGAGGHALNLQMV